jgi:hypothetical protein
MTTESTGVPTPQDREDAMTEVCFLLDILASTVDDLMGGATASVGRVAGRQLARRLPFYLPDATLPEVVACLSGQGQLGVIMSGGDAGKPLIVDHCVVREVCRRRGQELGGTLCQLYHHYLDGLINQMLLRPTRSTLKSAGDRCVLSCETR